MRQTQPWMRAGRVNESAGHKGKRFLFTGKYSCHLVTSSVKKGNAEKLPAISGPCSWPAADSLRP